MNAISKHDGCVSVIIPVQDAASWIEGVIEELDSTVHSLFRMYEIVLIDDASHDETAAIIRNLQQRVESLQLFCLNRTVGFDVATVAGLDNCIGDFVFVLNVETDPVNILPGLWAKAQEGYEVVAGVRQDRVRGGFRALLARLYYRLFDAATGVRIPRGVANPRVLSRRVVNYILQNNDRGTMLKVLPFFSSYRIGTVEYAAVNVGDSFGEQGLWNATLTGVTMILGCSSRPLRLFTSLALLSSGVSLSYCLYVIAVSIFNRHVVQGWLSLAFPLAILSFFISVLLGIVGEYVYMLVQRDGHRPTYLIVAESSSSILEVRQKLNVIEGSGEFVDRQP